MYTDDISMRYKDFKEAYFFRYVYRFDVKNLILKFSSKWLLEKTILLFYKLQNSELCTAQITNQNEYFLSKMKFNWWSIELFHRLQSTRKFFHCFSDFFHIWRTLWPDFLYSCNKFFLILKWLVHCSCTRWSSLNSRSNSRADWCLENLVAIGLF